MSEAGRHPTPAISPPALQRRAAAAGAGARESIAPSRVCAAVEGTGRSMAQGEHNPNPASKGDFDGIRGGLGRRFEEHPKLRTGNTLLAVVDLISLRSCTVTPSAADSDLWNFVEARSDRLLHLVACHGVYAPHVARSSAHSTAQHIDPASAHPFSSPRPTGPRPPAAPAQDDESPSSLPSAPLYSVEGTDRTAAHSRTHADLESEEVRGPGGQVETENLGSPHPRTERSASTLHFERAKRKPSGQSLYFERVGIARPRQLIVRPQPPSPPFTSG